MEQQNIKLLILHNNVILITQIEEVGSELGEPDCKLIEPFVVNKNDLTNSIILEPWLIDVTSQNTYMIHSDKILTIADPKPTLLEKYQNLIK
jgi:hypothetical protein